MLILNTLARGKEVIVSRGQLVEIGGSFRLPVDRVFTLHGFGTIIAGTILSGEVRVGDKIEIYPERIVTRVRSTFSPLFTVGGGEILDVEPAQVQEVRL